MSSEVGQETPEALTAYFDEGGHSSDPILRYVGMGGFVAPSGEWHVFEERWRDTLTKAGLAEPFHMKDFAHSRGQFKTWQGKEDDRRRLFAQLIQLIRDTKAEPIGVAISLTDFDTLTMAQRSGFKDPYYFAFQTCTRGAAVAGFLDHPDKKVNTVYALNSEFGTDGGRAKDLWDLLQKTYDHGRRLGSYLSSTPDEFCALQAADIFAYELCHEFENQVRRPKDRMRWGLRQILKMSQIPLSKIRLFDRKELLRIIKESQWPDQTGTEELSGSQKRSAQEVMLSWSINRGEYEWDPHYDA